MLLVKASKPFSFSAVHHTYEQRRPISNGMQSAVRFSSKEALRFASFNSFRSVSKCRRAYCIEPAHSSTRSSMSMATESPKAAELANEVEALKAQVAQLEVWPAWSSRTLSMILQTSGLLKFAAHSEAKRTRTELGSSVLPVIWQDIDSNYFVQCW
jgi:hypothetical protein